MNKDLLVWLVILTISSCIEKQDIQGGWHLDFSEEVDGAFFPYDLLFKGDTLLLVDGHIFKQYSSFKLQRDSIYMTFDDGRRYQYSFIVESDSFIQLAGKRFFRKAVEFFPKAPPYQLLGWMPTNKAKLDTNPAAVIHLIKDGELSKVLFNDVVLELKTLPDIFFDLGHKTHSVCLYIGQGVKLRDLADVYCWMNYCGFQTVELVTANKSFEEFYSIRDSINISDSLFYTFLTKNSLTQIPPKKRDDLFQVEDIYITSGDKLDLHNLSGEILYQFHISAELDIRDYLSLVDDLKHSSKKVTKCFE